MSQICAFNVLPSTLIDRVANSTPMVDFVSRLNSLRVNRERTGGSLRQIPNSPCLATHGPNTHGYWKNTQRSEQHNYKRQKEEHARLPDTRISNKDDLFHRKATNQCPIPLFPSVGARTLNK